MGKLTNTNALSFIKTLENDSVDLILTDPPYLYDLPTRKKELYTVKLNHKKLIKL
ncbi:hypothetical protein [Spiroplasma endosymbiont of Polydrusus cervinus]|uniref:hypothetical protein n=1 Tax=Spiroplasma endosymbiont of Polydrusus cervinus TaxID=3066287 RepID=UPI0030D06945